MTHKTQIGADHSIIFWVLAQGGAPAPQYQHTTLYTLYSFQLLVRLSCTKYQHSIVSQCVKRRLLAKPLNQHHCPQLTEGETIKCLSQDKNLRSIWISTLDPDYTLSLLFLTCSGPEWLFVRHRSCEAQLLHFQSQNHKLVTSFSNKQIQNWISRCQLYLWWTFKPVWAAAIPETQQSPSLTQGTP